MPAAEIPPLQRLVLAFYAFFAILFRAEVALAMHRLREARRVAAPLPEGGAPPLAARAQTIETPRPPAPPKPAEPVAPKPPTDPATPVAKGAPKGTTTANVATGTVVSPDPFDAGAASVAKAGRAATDTASATAPTAPAAPAPATAPRAPVAVAPVAVAPVAAAPAPAPSADPAVALRVLAVLQREGRLVDFIEEDLTGFPDAAIGAAARTVHAGCKKAIEELFRLEPVYRDREGATVTVDRGFDPTAVRLTGNVVGEPPFKGALRHHGWRAKVVKLPPTDAKDAAIVAPAEVEL